MSAEVDIRFCFPLKNADRYFPGPSGRPISLPTLFRWTSRGLRGVRLRTIRLGGTRCTCETWVLEFIAALNGNRTEAVEQLHPVDDEALRRRKVAAALDAAGL
jgi:hypothetical protein